MGISTRKVDCVFLAASIEWTAPPPQFTQTDPNDIRTVNMSVVNGSTQVALTWSYTLPDGIGVRTTNFRKGASPGASLSDVGSIFHDIGTYRLLDARFNISRSEVATLIINKVTEREGAVYQCEVETSPLNRWKSNIRVIVTGEIAMYKLIADTRRCQSINRSSILTDNNQG